MGFGKQDARWLARNWYHVVLWWWRKFPQYSPEGRKRRLVIWIHSLCMERRRVRWLATDGYHVGHWGISSPKYSMRLREFDNRWFRRFAICPYIIIVWNEMNYYTMNLRSELWLYRRKHTHSRIWYVITNLFIVELLYFIQRACDMRVRRLAPKWRPNSFYSKDTFGMHE